MEILPSPPHISNPNWLVDQAMPSKWTQYENKLFENALAVYGTDTPDRWAKVAEMIPGKTVWDVMNQYRELEEDVCNIEAGLIPIPGYVTPRPSQFSFDWDNTYGYDYGFRAYSARRRTPEQERKKGVPWTEDEHRLFLLGLKKYGKGDWRNISRNFVVSRTPTQVASHAQKFFVRQLSGAKYKRRASIHDITTVNLSEATTTTTTATPSRSPPPPPSEINNNRSNSNSIITTNEAHFQWNQPNAEVAMGFDPYYGVKLQGQNLQTSALHEASYLAHQTQNFKFQTQHLPHA